MRRWIRLLAVGTALTVGLSACSSAGTSSNAPSRPAIATSTAAPSPAYPSSTAQARSTTPSVQSGDLGNSTPVIAFANDTHGWLAIGTRVLSTGDGGTHWTERSSIRTGVDDLDFISTSEGWAATPGGLLHTTDAARDWTPIDTPQASKVGSVDFVDNQHGWIGSETGLLVTDDGGVSWRAQSSPCTEEVGPSAGLFSFVSAANGFDLCPGNPGSGAQRKTLYRTGDGGATWALIAEAKVAGAATPSAGVGALSAAGYATNLHFLDASDGWISLERGGVEATSDGGRTWRMLASVEDADEFLYGVDFTSAKHGYVIAWPTFQNGQYDQGVAALYRTDDAGSSWQRTAIGDFTTPIAEQTLASVPTNQPRGP